MEFTGKKTVQILVLILVIGALLRFTGLGNNSFVADEFLDINSTYGYLKTGIWKAWDFNYMKPAEMNQNDARDERAALYKWQVAQVFAFIAPTEGAARSVSVLWGLACIILTFWVAYQLTGRKEIGLLAAFLLAVSVSALMFDRRLRMYAMFAPVYLALSWTLFVWLEGKKLKYDGFLSRWNTATGMQWLWLPLVLLLGFLALKIHLLSINIVPVASLYILILALVFWKNGEGWKNKYAMLALAGLFLILSLALLQPTLLGLVLSSFTLFDNHYSYFGYIAENYWHPLIGFSLILWGGWYLSRHLHRKKEALWLNLSFWVPLFLAAFFWNRNEGPQYIFFAQAFGIILAALGLFGVLSWVQKSAGNLSTRARWGITLFLLLLVPNWGYFLLENNTYHETSSSSNPNYRKVFAYFKKNQSSEDVLITRNFRNYYWSGARVPVYDFGGEVSRDKLTLEDIQAIMRDHSQGWLILSSNDYDYVSHDAEDFFKKNMVRVSNAQVRGEIEVYRWGQPDLAK